jgi:CheY-like chemotaxis protein
MQEKADDKRRSKRVPYNETVLVNDSLEVHCNDISEGGLFVHMNKALLPGNAVTIKFPDRPMKFEAVVQVVPDTGGLGLMFAGMDSTHLRVLREIIIDAEKAVPEPKSTSTVLLVEESDSIRKLNMNSLVSEGFEVLEAADGMEALKMLHAMPPDAVMLELEVKRVDGFGVLEFMKSSPGLKDIPVLAVSSRMKLEEQSKAVAAGASMFLSKTTTPPAKLASILRKLLQSFVPVFLRYRKEPRPGRLL